MPKAKPLYVFGRIVLTPIFKVIYRTKYHNKNNIPEEGKFILACNHITYSDPVVLGLGQKRQLYFMAKSELFKNKAFGALIKALGAFPVYRGEGDKEAINHGEELLKNGNVMAIFIEGTRSRTGELLRPRSGAAMIAYATQTPVIPACITIKGGGRKRFGKRIVRFGEPMSVEELGLKTGSSKEFRDASRKIMEKITEMREHDLWQQ